MTARPAPFSKAIKAHGLDCLDGGRHRLLIFTGPRAWEAGKWYIGRGTPSERREGYVLVLPPDDTLAAVQMRWPVQRRAVLIVDTGAGLHRLEPLIDALRRDGACSCMRYDLAAERAADFGGEDLDFALHRMHCGDAVAPMLAWGEDYSPAVAA